MKNIMSKRNVILVTIIVLCIIAILLVVLIQYLKVKSIEELRKETEEKENQLSENLILERDFDNIFLNNINVSQNILEEINKIKPNKEIVYSKYKGEKKQENKYTVNVNIPFININNELANQYNKEIEEIFVEKLKKVMTESKNEIYTVEYTSNINDNMFNIIIKSTLKQQGGTQRIIIKTYCFDIKDETEIKLKDILNKKNIDEQIVQEKIIQKIKDKQNEALALEQLGYTIYKRDYTDGVYLIQNIDNFYMDENGYIYILFPYGNNYNTGELDIIVI